MQPGANTQHCWSFLETNTACARSSLTWQVSPGQLSQPVPIMLQEPCVLSPGPLRLTLDLPRCRLEGPDREGH